MSSGIVTTTTPKHPKGSLQGIVSTSGWPVSSQNMTFDQQRILVPETVTSFRSGPGFDREAGKPDSVVNSQQSLASLLRSVDSRDIGHDYLKHGYTSIRGVSYSRSGFNIPLIQKGMISAISFSGAPYNAYQVPTTLPSSPITDAQIRTVGTSFINETQPLRSEADLLVSFAELLREGLPHTLGSLILRPNVKNRRQLVKAAGSEYLNYVFGISPVIRDVAVVWQTLARINDLVDQWVRDNGRQIRRHRSTASQIQRTDLTVPPTIVNPGSMALAYMGPGSTPGSVFRHIGVNTNLWGGGSWVAEREGYQTTTTDYRFSGAYMYDLSKLLPVVPEKFGGSAVLSSYDIRGILALHALGLAPDDASGNTVWNLTPFSWLVDWFVNIGEMLDNFRAFQTAGLQLRYGYVNCKVKTETRVLARLRINGSTYYSTSVNWERIYFRRLRATPFGFGVTYDGLSSYQLSVLGALASQGL
jgi:hypothetical protein